MSVVLNFEKTAMIQPDMELFEHFKSTKKDLARISEMNKTNEKDERIKILQEVNERLNSEITQLKRKVCSVSQTKNEFNDKDKLLSAMKVLKSQYENEKKQRMLLSLKVKKLETLYDDAFDDEDAPSVQSSNNIQDINKNLSFLLDTLKSNNNI